MGDSSPKRSGILPWMRKNQVFASLAVLQTLIVAGTREVMSGTEKASIRARAEHYEQKSELLALELADCKKRISALIADEKIYASWIEEFNTPAWIKELKNDELYTVIYVNKAYKMFLPNGLEHYDLYGQTGHLLDLEFGDIYQKSDGRAARSKLPILVLEPYRINGVGKVRYGFFVKGRIWAIKNRVVVFGVFSEESSKDAIDKFYKELKRLEEIFETENRTPAGINK